MKRFWLLTSLCLLGLACSPRSAGNSSAGPPNNPNAKGQTTGSPRSGSNQTATSSEAAGDTTLASEGGIPSPNAAPDQDRLDSIKKAKTNAKRDH